MARIALLDASPSTATAVSAVAPDHTLVACRSGEPQPEADLLVVDIAGPEPVSLDLLAGVQARAGILLLVERRARVADDVRDDARVEVLRRPFDLFELRSKLDSLIHRFPSGIAPATADGSSVAPIGPEEAVGGGEPLPSWLESPLVPAFAATTLAAARSLGGPVWLVGEFGSGRDRVAAALASAWDVGRDPVFWFAGDPLDRALAALGDRARVLMVPGIDGRPLSEQRAFEAFLLLHPDRRIAVTSEDEPADAVLAGSLPRSLYHCLARVAVRLAPLRERRGDIPALAQSAAARLSASAFGGTRVRFTEEASRALQAYDWPANLEELFAVVTRSVVAKTVPDSDATVLEAGDLLFAPPLSSTWQPATSVARPTSIPSRRGVVVPLTGFGRATEEPEQAEKTEASAPLHDDAASVEPLLQAFAHDIRNPMSTIQSFASLQASIADEDNSELARLAVEACGKIGEHLALLQSYSELAPSGRTRFDLLELVGEALDEAGEDAGVTLEVRRPLWVEADRGLLRFCADVVFAECRARRAESAAIRADRPALDRPGAGERVATVELAPGATALEIRIPVGDAAVDRLGKWVEGASLPWRLALARNAARRAGGDLEMETDSEQVRLRWRAPLAEEGRDGEQARSADRRRRSRSS